MAVPLNATPMDPAANAYLTVAETDTLLHQRLGAGAWTTADPETKARAIITATHWLDQYVYLGEPTTATQALQWPRRYVPRYRRGSGPSAWNTVWYDATVVPPPVAQATAELAFHLLTIQCQDEKTDPLAGDGLEGIAQLGITGSLSITPVQDGRHRHRLPPAVERAIAAVLADPAGRVQRA